MGVNSLPKTVTRQRRGCNLNPGPSVAESSTLTIQLESHHKVRYVPENHAWASSPVLVVPWKHLPAGNPEQTQPQGNMRCTVSFINHQAVTAGNDGQQNEPPASTSLHEVNKIVTKPSAMAAMQHTPI